MPTYQCPTCRKTVQVDMREDAPYRPFCTDRCQLIDLHRWFEGEYLISDPLTAESPVEDDQPPDARAPSRNADG